MRILVFIVTFVSGAFAVWSVNYLSAEAKPQPAAMFLNPSPIEAPPNPLREMPKRTNCVDANADQKLREQRLKKIDRLRKKVDKLMREIRKPNSLERDLEIRDETLSIQSDLKELERASEMGFPKAVYREICY